MDRPPAAHARRSRRSVCGLRGDPGSTERRGRRVLRDRHADLPDRRREARMRQALGGMLWCKQFYLYDVGAWLRERGVTPFSGRRARNTGQVPAYEWDFSDVNPSVHAWAGLYVYRVDAAFNGRADRDFLERLFHKLLL